MHIREILENTGEQIWDNKNHKWLTDNDDKEVEFAIVFGDDGGDTFISEFDNEEEFNKGLQEHYDGDTGCDFDTSIYHVIKNGKEYKPKVS